MLCTCSENVYDDKAVMDGGLGPSTRMIRINWEWLVSYPLVQALLPLNVVGNISDNMIYGSNVKRVPKHRFLKLGGRLLGRSEFGVAVGGWTGEVP